MIETPPDVLTAMGDGQTAMWQRTSRWKLPTDRLDRTNVEVYAAGNSPLMSIDVGKQIADAKNAAATVPSMMGTAVAISAGLLGLAG